MMMAQTSTDFVTSASQRARRKLKRQLWWHRKRHAKELDALQRRLDEALATKSDAATKSAVGAKVDADDARAGGENSLRDASSRKREKRKVKRATGDASTTTATSTTTDVTTTTLTATTTSTATTSTATTTVLTATSSTTESASLSPRDRLGASEQRCVELQVR